MKKNKYIIWGTGSYGRIAYESLCKEINIVGFCCNEQSEYGSTIQMSGGRVSVLSPSQLSNDVTIIIATGSQFWMVIEKQIKELGLNSVSFDDFYFSSHKRELNTIFRMMNDSFSKKVLCNVIKARAENDYSEIYKVYSDNQYFALPQMRASGSRLYETFIDVGAFTGDTIEKFLSDRTDVFKKIIAFEPAEKQFAALKKRCERLNAEWAFEENRIICEKLALSDKISNLSIFETKNNLGGTYVSDSNGDNCVQATSLDDYVKNDSIDFIKVDIEGFEMKFLIGAANTITRCKPKIAICIYHSPADFYRIPLYIKQLVPEYKMAVRHHSLGKDETVLYAWT